MARKEELKDYIRDLEKDMESEIAARDELRQELELLRKNFQDEANERIRLQEVREYLRASVDRLDAALTAMREERDELRTQVNDLTYDKEAIYNLFIDTAKERDELSGTIGRWQELWDGLDTLRHDAIVEALWGEGKAFDQLTDAVKKAAGGFSSGPAEYPVGPCECEACECMASEDDPIEAWRQAKPLDNPYPPESYSGDSARDGAWWMGLTPDEAAEWVNRDRRRWQFKAHLRRFAQPKAELWADMPWSPLKEAK